MYSPIRVALGFVLIVLSCVASVFAQGGTGQLSGNVVDANGAYSFAEALTIAQVLEEFDVAWFEEPVIADDKPGLAEVRAATNIPIVIATAPATATTSTMEMPAPVSMRMTSIPSGARSRRMRRPSRTTSGASGRSLGMRQRSSDSAASSGPT